MINKFKTVYRMAETIWSFGYGSNMNVNALEAKKHVKILDSTAAILKDHRMAFNIGGIHHVEPYFAGLVESPGDEVHGLAFKMDMESMANLDRNEGYDPNGKGYGGYKKSMVTLLAYDGRELEGYIYMNKTPPGPDGKPSSRYLGVLVKGAEQVGLKESYIEKLKAHPVYEPNEAVLRARARRPAPGDLPEITVEQLAQNSDWLSSCGYVMEVDGGFRSHRARDVTTRNLKQYLGIPMDDTDDGGRPPYPLLKDLSKGELEYVTQWLDRYSLNRDDTERPFVGYLKEFKEQQESGSTTYVLPPIPK